MMTPFGIQKLKDTLERLQHQDRPQAVKDVTEAVQKGDLSENAEYQEAKMRLSRIDSRIFSLKERIKNAIPIVEQTSTGRVQMGSSVTVRVRGIERTYRIVGPSETNPTQGRISHVSPLGSALMGCAVGDRVMVNEMEYEVIGVT